MRLYSTKEKSKLMGKYTINTVNTKVAFIEYTKRSFSVLQYT